MRRTCVVFSKTFVLGSMGNELVPSPLKCPAYSSGRYSAKVLSTSFSNSVVAMVTDL